MPTEPTVPSPHAARGRALCLAAALLWSTSGLFIKRLTGPAPSGAAWSGWQVAGIRSLLAGVFLLLIGRPDRLLPRAHQWLVAVLTAGTMLPYVLAQTYTTTASAILLQYAAPVYVLALSPWLLAEPLQRRDLLAIAAVAGGIAMILPTGNSEGSSWFGNAMGLLSGFAFAGVVVALRKWRDGSGVLGLAWGNLLTAAVALGVAVLPPRRFTPIGLSSGCQIGFLGLIQIGLAYFLFHNGIRYIRAAEASLWTLLEPVACPLWAWLFLGDRPPCAALAGGALILLTLALHSLAVLHAKRGRAAGSETSTRT